MVERVKLQATSNLQRWTEISGPTAIIALVRGSTSNIHSKDHEGKDILQG